MTSAARRLRMFVPFGHVAPQVAVGDDADQRAWQSSTTHDMPRPLLDIS